MSVITLTSDWGTDSLYLAIAKGYILKNCPDATIIDISNQIKPFDFRQASFILKHAHRHFPKDTIHVLAVCSSQSSNYKWTIVRANGQYFISNDCGQFSLMFDNPEEIEKIYRINDITDVLPTFEEYSVLIKAACHLANKKKIHDLAVETIGIEKQFLLQPTIDETTITGKVAFIDVYKNVITNISRELFYEICNGRLYNITFKSTRNKITRISDTYQEVESGELFAIFNSMGLLEIGLSKGNAAELLDLNYDTVIRINFF